MNGHLGPPVRQQPDRGGRLVRLTAVDRMFLSLECTAWPEHVGGLAVVEAAPLLDTSGQLRIDEIRQRLERRLERVPELRRRLLVPGLLQGGPLWVDDVRFDIRRHVLATTVDSPGNEAALLEAAGHLCEHLLDRRRPLWELWFLTGLRDGRLGVLFKLHHSVGDGSAAVRILGSLFDGAPGAADPAAVAWAPEPVPTGRALLADNLAAKREMVVRVAAALAHPRRVVERVRPFTRVLRRGFGEKGAPRTSLNEPVERGRRIRFLSADLEALKAAAHVQGGTVNDVVLALWAGGLRRLLVSRGESVARLALAAGLAVSTRTSNDAAIANRVGTAVLPLPVDEADVRRRLDAIVEITRRVKAQQSPAATMGALAVLAATPIGRYFARHQRAVNVTVTDVVGPPLPMYVLGARIEKILPVIDLDGNVGLTLCAFSYAGQIFLVVTADARAFPDLDVPMRAMEADWEALIRGPFAEAVPA